MSALGTPCPPTRTPETVAKAPPTAEVAVENTPAAPDVTVEYTPTAPDVCAYLLGERTQC